eukprot:CAMPEP_0119573444 /NCGR_PEP_ID=MMETSP1352-20130426/45125_1 /TAXON_ID=265584 /ORGANISM="Stauroneis constricta, Strain CCMP1120" /LENGTH=391 /DNA_ID=CAMNT_0007623133 /DNA_START=497 /DNA_END=1672 /DNA_ORIENTATION=-
MAAADDTLVAQPNVDHGDNEEVDSRARSRHGDDDNVTSTNNTQPATSSVVTNAHYLTTATATAPATTPQPDIPIQNDVIPPPPPEGAAAEAEIDAGIPSDDEVDAMLYRTYMDEVRCTNEGSYGAASNRAELQFPPFAPLYGPVADAKPAATDAVEDDEDELKPRAEELPPLHVAAADAMFVETCGKVASAAQHAVVDGPSPADAIETSSLPRFEYKTSLTGSEMNRLADSWNNDSDGMPDLIEGALPQDNEADDGVDPVQVVHPAPPPANATVIPANYIPADQVNDSDILQGRGGGTYGRPGNKALVGVVRTARYYDAYCRANASRQERSAIVDRILEHIGGRFLKPAKELDGIQYYVEMNDKERKDKVRDCFKTTTKSIKARGRSILHE